MKLAEIGWNWVECVYASRVLSLAHRDRLNIVRTRRTPCCGQFESFPGGAKAISNGPGNKSFWLLRLQVETSWRLKLTPAGPNALVHTERAQVTHHELDQKTPRPSGPQKRWHSARTTRHTWQVSLPPSVYNAPVPNSTSSPWARSSVSATITLLARLLHPSPSFDQLVQSHTQRVYTGGKTHSVASKWRTAEEAGIVPGRHEKLSAVSQGLGLIPFHSRWSPYSSRCCGAEIVRPCSTKSTWIRLVSSSRTHFS